MTKFYDGKKILSISMTDDRTGIDFENEFFEIGQLPYNMELDANKVDDVDYLIDYAVTYANGTNTDFEYQYDEDGNLLDGCSGSYTVEDMRPKQQNPRCPLWTPGAFQISTLMRFFERPGGFVSLILSHIQHFINAFQPVAYRRPAVMRLCCNVRQREPLNVPQ